MASSRFHGLSFSPAGRGWLQRLSRSLKRPLAFHAIGLRAEGEATASMVELGQGRACTCRAAQAELWGSGVEAAHRPKEAGGSRCQRTPTAFPGVIALAFPPTVSHSSCEQDGGQDEGNNEQVGAHYFPHSDAMNIILLLFVAAVKIDVC